MESEGGEGGVAADVGGVNRSRQGVARPVERFRAYAAAGAQHAIFRMSGQPAEDVRLFGRTVIPALRDA